MVYFQSLKNQTLQQCPEPALASIYLIMKGLLQIFHNKCLNCWFGAVHQKQNRRSFSSFQLSRLTASLKFVRQQIVTKIRDKVQMLCSLMYDVAAGTGGSDIIWFLFSK